MTLHHVAFTAVHEGLLTLPLSCEVSLICKEARTLQAAWTSKSPSKGHREPLKAVKALIAEQGHTLNFREV